MKKFVALMLALVMVLTLVACGSKEQAPADGGETTPSSETTPSGEAVKITLATGGTSGTYYAVGGVIGTVLGPKLTLSSLTVESTGASKANVNMITDGEAQMAILQSDVVNYAHNGTNTFEGEVETALCGLPVSTTRPCRSLPSPASTTLLTSRARPSASATSAPVPKSTPGRSSAPRA